MGGRDDAHRARRTPPVPHRAGAVREHLHVVRLLRLVHGAPPAEPAWTVLVAPMPQTLLPMATVPWPRSDPSDWRQTLIWTVRRLRKPVAADPLAGVPGGLWMGQFVSGLSPRADGGPAW